MRRSLRRRPWRRLPSARTAGRAKLLKTDRPQRIPQVLPLTSTLVLSEGPAACSRTGPLRDHPRSLHGPLQAGFCRGAGSRRRARRPLPGLYRRPLRHEEELREADPQARALARSSRSLAWLAPMESALQRAAADPTVLPQSALLKAVHYALERWEALTRFAQPGFGHVHIDSNACENAIRPTAVGKKNCLFVGHPSAGWRSAVIYSVLGTWQSIRSTPGTISHGLFHASRAPPPRPPTSSRPSASWNSNRDTHRAAFASPPDYHPRRHPTTL